MKKNSPVLQASKFKPAQKVIHKYNISQWKMTDYIVLIDQLPGDGIMPTDSSMAEAIGSGRAKGGVCSSVKSLIVLNLVKITRETSAGFAYELTGLGRQALIEINEVIASFQTIVEADEEPPAPDYSAGFERMNREIKRLNEQLENQQVQLNNQESLISYQKAQISMYENDLNFHTGEIEDR